MPSIHTPYRICPLGAHVDHQFGLVTGFALNFGVTLDYEPDSSGNITLTSKNFLGDVHTDVFAAGVRQMYWGDYVCAAVAALLNRKEKLSVGIRGEIFGTLPIGGLSSSASVVITYLRALCLVNNITISQDDLIHLAHWAETQYIGLNNGILDQSCEVLSKKNCLLYLDTQPDAKVDAPHTPRYELIPQARSMPAYEILIVFSGLERMLINSAYNARVDECKAAAYALKAYAGMPYELFSDIRLRDVREEAFLDYGEKLPENWYKRAKHYYSEVARVRDGAGAWRMGDIKRFGQIVFESGDSSIYNYESGSPELKALHDIAKTTDGIYGGRFSGAGFKGCYLAIVDPAFHEHIVQSFTQRYSKAFPSLKDRFSIHFCQTADGVCC